MYKKHTDGHQLQCGLDLSAGLAAITMPSLDAMLRRPVMQQVARNQHHNHPGRRAAHRRQKDQHRRDHELVGQGIEKLAKTLT